MNIRTYFLTTLLLCSGFATAMDEETFDFEFCYTQKEKGLLQVVGKKWNNAQEAYLLLFDPNISWPARTVRIDGHWEVGIPLEAAQAMTIIKSYCVKNKKVQTHIATRTKEGKPELFELIEVDENEQ